MEHIVFLDRATLTDRIVAPALSFDHSIDLHETTTPEQTAERIAHASIVVTNKVRIDAQTLKNAHALRFIAIAATGTDAVDLDACRARGIAVSNIRGYANRSVGEHVFALIFGLRRSIAAYNSAIARGRWQDSGRFSFLDYPISDIRGSTIGIFGGGGIGSAVGDMARALGLNVLVASRKGDQEANGRVAFDEVLKQSDIISLHLPLTAETYSLFGQREFALMERNPIFINTARGALVDEESLEEALISGRISGIGHDVSVQEPPSSESPLMRLVGRADVLLTPHVAWGSDQSVQALVDQLYQNIETYVSNKSINRVV